MHRYVGRSAGVVAQQRHHLHGFAGPVDAAIEPDIGIERTGMRQRRSPRDRTGRTPRRSGRAACSRRRPAPRPRAARPDRRHASAARRSGRHRRPSVAVSPRISLLSASRRSVTPARGVHVGVAAHLHGQPVGAAPDGGREVSAQDHLHAGRRVRRAVTGNGTQRVEAGAGPGERIRHRQRGVCAAVRLPIRYVRGALPDNAPALLADPFGVPGFRPAGPVWRCAQSR